MSIYFFITKDREEHGVYPSTTRYHDIKVLIKLNNLFNIILMSRLNCSN